MIRRIESLDDVRKSSFKEVVLEIERLIPDYRAGGIDFHELCDISDVYRRGVANRECARNIDLREEDVFPAVDMGFYKAIRDFEFSEGTRFSTWFRQKVKGEISSIRRVRDGSNLKYKRTESLNSTNRDGETRLDDMFFENSFIKDVDDSDCIKTYIPKFLEGLSQRDKLIVYLRYGCGMGLRKIGERIGRGRDIVGKILKSSINPKLSERIERLEIPYRPELINKFLREYYEENKGFVNGEDSLTNLPLESLVHYCQFGNNGAFQDLYGSLASDLDRTIEVQRRKFPSRIHLMDIETGTLDGLRYAVENFNGQSPNFERYLRDMIWKKTRSWVKKMYPLKRKKLTFRSEEEESHYWERIEDRGKDSIRDFEDKEHTDIKISSVLEDFDFRDSEIIYLKYGLGMQNIEIIKKMKMQETTFYRRLIRIKPIIRGRVERFDIPYNPEIFMGAIRDFYQDREFYVKEDVKEDVADFIMGKL